MSKFVFAYRGSGMAETPEAQQKAMDEWTAWFAVLGADMVDGGNPFGVSATVSAAGEKAKGCSALASGDTVEVHEALPMG